MQYWLRLKLDLLPCIAQEVDKVSQDYLLLLERLRKGDKSVMQDILLMQGNIKSRIEEFDAFYDKNYADDRIAYFEKLKIKLRKLLYTQLDMGTNDTVKHVQKDHEPKFRADISMDEPKLGGFPHHNDNRQIQPQQMTSTSMNMAPQSQKIKAGSSRVQENIISDKKKPTTPATTTTANNTNSGLRGDRSITPTRSKSPISSKKDTTPIQEKQIVDQKSKTKTTQPAHGKTITKQEDPNEIVFTIKMTKEEYTQYMQTKNPKLRKP